MAAATRAGKDALKQFAQVAPEPHTGDARLTSHLRSVSGAQVRDGRALLGWTPRDLARMANVGVFTVNQIELVEGPSRYPGLATIEATLKAKGIVFLYGAIPGVRVRRKRKK